MSNNYKHKFLGKWNNGFNDSIPIAIKKFWNRKNFDKGYYLNLRNKKILKALNKDIKTNE